MGSAPPDGDVTAEWVASGPGRRLDGRSSADKLSGWHPESGAESDQPAPAKVLEIIKKDMGVVKHNPLVVNGCR
jgi:hypothetical protein